jgi:hypothetical protein
VLVNGIAEPVAVLELLAPSTIKTRLQGSQRCGLARFVDRGCEHASYAALGFSAMRPLVSGG